MATHTSSTDDESTTIEEIEQRIDERFRSSFDEPLLSKGPVELLVYAVSIVFFGYHMWYGYTAELPRSQHGIIHLALVVCLWGLLKFVSVETDNWRGKLLAAGYAVYAVVAVVPLYYMNSRYQDLVMRAGSYTNTDIMMGALLIVLILIALASISRLITIIAAFGLVYSYFGPLMPGILNHRGLSPNRIVTMNTVELQGLLGTLLQISATWVVIFLILAGLMEKYGGMAAFIKGVTRIAARSRYIEIGQVAVAASAFMGSINGSTAANTATTGAFTIPLMKENGYSPRLAAAIESVASCGGQILPPIMGAGAFLMAELIDPTYSEIIISAVVPATLFFLTVGISISLNSRRTVTSKKITVSDDRSAIDRVTSLMSHYEYLVMFAVLLYWLVYVQADPMVAGFYSIAVLIGLRFIRLAIGSDEPFSERVRLFGRETLAGLHRGAEATVDITILLASLGIVIRALIVTGFAQQLSTQIVMFAGGNLLVLLVLVMFSSIAFGMGMSTTAAYMLVAILVAPSLLDTGLDPLISHLYVFYFAIVSNITPPIALSVVIAQGIAGSDYLETAVEALKIGFPMFLLPYAFVFNQSLISLGPMTIVAFVIVLVGFVAISAGLAGQLTQALSVPLRVGLFATGLALLFAPLTVQGILVLVVVGGMLYLSQYSINLRTVAE
jgi:TRAP transporter 4TM/12TM fusion protein